MYHAQFEAMGFNQCLGGVPDQAELLANLVSIYAANHFDYAVHFVRVDTPESNSTRVTQYWCNICSR